MKKKKSSSKTQFFTPNHGSCNVSLRSAANKLRLPRRKRK